MLLAAFWWFATAGPSASEILSPLASAGVAGVVVLLFVTDRISSNSERDRLRQVADKTFNEFLPQMLQQTSVLQELVRQMGELNDRERERQIRADFERRRDGP